MSARTAACLCGTTVVAIAHEEPHAVAAHNATYRHQSWREAGGMWMAVYGELPPPEVMGEPAILAGLRAQQAIVLDQQAPA